MGGGSALAHFFGVVMTIPCGKHYPRWNGFDYREKLITKLDHAELKTLQWKIRRGTTPVEDWAFKYRCDTKWCFLIYLGMLIHKMEEFHRGQLWLGAPSFE